MPPRQRQGTPRAPSAPGGDDTEAYRLVAIRPTPAPAGCAGRDWLVYEIAQGANVITGYRQGDLRAATADVEKIVVALNERRVKSKGRPGPKPKHAASTAEPAAAVSGKDRAADGAADNPSEAAPDDSDEHADGGEADAGDEDEVA